MSHKSENLKRKTQMNENLVSKFDSDFIVNKKIKIEEMKQFLMPVHIVTCGLQGSDLGRDETAVIQICVNLIDVSKMEIIGERSILFQASSLLDQSADPEKIHISIPAREMTGLLSMPSNESRISLQQALNEIDNFIQSYTFNTNPAEIDIIPVTVGHLPLRSVLHKEARFRSITLRNYWYSYFDLCEQMSFCYQSNFSSMKDICTAIQVVYCELSAAIISNMSHTALYLLKYGYTFSSRHIITTGYTPTVFHVDDAIDDDVVVVIKPIDYKTPIGQVLPFFNGVNIADGGVAVMMSEGRRSNKILVRLADKLQRDIALLRDKHHLEPGSTRYITMSTFDSREFMKIAGYEDDSVKDYLIRITSHEQVLIRMKGLPFTVTKEDILRFFILHETEIQIGLEGIFLVQKPSGDLNGDAFIIFNDEIQASKATDLKGSMIGNRYVEIFHSTPAEMNQVIAGIKSGSSLARVAKRPCKSRELENSDSIQSMYQKQLSLLSGGLLQNIICNKPDSFRAATLTSFIPIDASDSDFIKFLGECQASCLNISRYNINNPTGYTSYIARYKNTFEAQEALKTISDKLFRVEQINKEFQVKSTLLSLTAPSIFKAYSNPNPMIQKTPLNAINMIPAVFPISPTIVQPSFNIQNPIQMTNVNYGSFPSLYSFNQYNPLSLLSGPLQQNFFASQMSPQLTFPSPVTNGYISTGDLNINSINNDIFLQKLQTVPALSQATYFDKSSAILLFGVQIPLTQQDCDVLFSSLIQSITALPRLQQINQLFYGIFRSPEDVKVALNRCPIILYKNQMIYLIPIN